MRLWLDATAPDGVMYELGHWRGMADWLADALGAQGDDAWMQRLELESVSSAKGAAGMEQ